MKQLVGITLNELIKMYKKRRLLVVILIPTLLFLAGGIYGYFHKTELAQQQNWRAGVSLQLASEQQSEVLLSPSKQKQVQQIIAVDRFELAHNVSPQPIDAILTNTTGVSIYFVLPMLFIILGGDIISAEVTDGTMKTMLLRPVTRKQILMAKFIALMISAIGVKIYLDILTYLMSSLFTGNWNGLSHPVLISGFFSTHVSVATLSIVSPFIFLILGYVINIISFAGIISLIMFISYLIRNPAMSVSANVIIILFGQLIPDLIHWNGLQYFPMTNFDLVNRLLVGQTNSGISFVSSAVILILWSVIALIVTFYGFSRRDLSN